MHTLLADRASAMLHQPERRLAKAREDAVPEVTLKTERLTGAGDSLGAPTVQVEREPAERRQREAAAPRPDPAPIPRGAWCLSSPGRPRLGSRRADQGASSQVGFDSRRRAQVDNCPLCGEGSLASVYATRTGQNGCSRCLPVAESLGSQRLANLSP